MSTKKEIYYKFIFPNYDSLSGSDSDSFPTVDGSGSNSFPTWDGDDQDGEVRALCRICPERVITYDQLTATNPKPMYANGTNGWSVDKKTAIKNYIDKYLKIPKYFDLRNYEDTVSTQRLGMSLMVSDSPEVGGDYSHYTKFDFDGKTIYCAVMISSGDFFYNFCLPEEVLIKSGLLDEITASKFHTNWFITNDDISIRRAVPRAIHFNNSDYIYYSNSPSSHQYIPDTDYPGYPYVSLSSLNSPSPENPLLDHEKRVFVQHYFSNHFQYGLQSGDSVSVHGDFNEDLKQDFLGLEATRRILYYYDGVRLKNPDNDNLITIASTDDIPILMDKVDYPSGIPQGYLWWSSGQTSTNTTPIQINSYIDGSWREVTVYTRAAYAQNNCAMLRDWSKQITKIITENINKIGKNTQISYEPPDIYRTDKGGCPPLQIPYNILRYTLNDRPPFTDCETVLVMWVANGDPDTISDSDSDKVKKLHDLGWEQYAIPISCRCCFNNKNDRDNGFKHIHNRFLIDYPKKWDYYYTYNGDTDNPANTVFNIAATDMIYRFHTRRAEMYDSNDTNEDTRFKEVLYLQDLIRYSNDYIIAYQNTAYYNKGFDIQGYLFTNYSSDFAKLYVSKTFVKPSLNDGHTISNATGISMNQQGQFYYIRVNKTDSHGNNVFDINTDGYSSSNRRICICEPNTTNVFKPSDRIYRLNINGEKWVYDASNFIAPTTKVSILGEVKDFGFDDMSYYQTYGYNDWFIYDSYLIALFKKPSGITTLTKQLTLTGHTSLYNDLGKWNNIYISSLGVTQYNPVLVDAVLLGGGQTTIYPLGILDNHIQLDGITYGSSTSNGIVIGFANMLDYLQEDLYHFKYINNEYRPVKTSLLDYSSSSQGPVDIPTSYTCTAYIMNYSQS